MVSGPLVKELWARDQASEFSLGGDDCEAFLNCWSEGNIGAVRREWPEAPEHAFIKRYRSKAMGGMLSNIGLEWLPFVMLSLVVMGIPIWLAVANNGNK